MAKTKPTNEPHGAYTADKSLAAKMDQTAVSEWVSVRVRLLHTWRMVKRKQIKFIDLFSEKHKSEQTKNSTSTEVDAKELMRYLCASDFNATKAAIMVTSI